MTKPYDEGRTSIGMMELELFGYEAPPETFEVTNRTLTEKGPPTALCRNSFVQDACLQIAE